LINSIKKLVNTLGILKVIKWLLSNYPKRMALTLFGILIAGILEAISIVTLLPVLAGVLNDSSVESNTMTEKVEAAFQYFSVAPSLENLLFFIVILVIIKSVITYFAITYAGYTTSDIVVDIRRNLVTKIMRTKYLHFTKQKTGDTTAILINEAQKSGIACMETIRLLSKSIEISVYIILAFTISLHVTVGAVSVGLLAMLALSKIIKQSRIVGNNHNQQVRSFSSNLIDGLGVIKSIKAMGREKHLMRFLKMEVDELGQLQCARVRNDELLRDIQEPIKVISAAACLFLIANYWDGSVESLLVLIYLFIKTVSYLGTIQQHYHSFSKFEPAFWSVREALKSMHTKRETFSGEKTVSLSNKIEFKGVSFNYESKKVLDNLNCIIPAGKFIAIYGPSGMGKTTIVDMICGLIKPDSGELLFDGISLDDVDIKFWRNNIGYVQQDMFLLNDSIINNISLGDRKITESTVENALKKAGAWDFVSDMPKGIHSIVGEKGGKFSGGQRQRLAIARALVREPKLLILDEVTSSLDTDTEMEICKTLKELGDEVTIIAISHQQAMLKSADIVYKCDKGILKTDQI
jgi:ATP-binding cassette, subfamily C, bacterial